MKLRTLSLIWWVFVVAPHGGLAQNLERITRLELEYWRAFEGEIKIEIDIPFQAKESEMILNATVTAGKKDGAGEKHISKKIKEQDLQAVLKFFNSDKARQFFAKAEPVLQPDGAALSITATQNSLSLTFFSQYAFTDDPRLASGQQEDAKELGRVALELLKLAGITIPKDRLH